MSTVLLSTIDSSIVYQTQGSVAPYTEIEGTGIAFTLSLNKRENVFGALPLNSVRIEAITILSPQKYGATIGNEAFDRVVSANLYAQGNNEPVGSLSLVKEQRNINMGVEELPFYAYKFTFPKSVPVSQGITYTVDLLKDDGTPISVSINTGVPATGSLSRAVYTVKKSSIGYTSPNAATPLVEITGSDDVLSPTPDEPNKTKTDPLDTNSLVYADNVRVEEAKRFIRNIRWRWDLVSERGAKPKNGFRPKMAMRRFAPGAPLNSIRLILDMITDAAPYVNPIVSGDIIQGRWKPKVTWFRKDMQQQTYDMRGDATVTIVQDLVPDYEDGESDLVNAGGDCSEITEYEYVWDAAEVSAPSMPYPQGVTYGIQGVNRDDDSGLFSYMLVKRTAVEQHFGPYISISSAKSYATMEVYKNAYNIPADLPQEGDVVDGGKVTRVSISVNDNCTYNIQIDRSFTSKAKAQKSCMKTVFDHNETEQVTGQESALGEAPAASGGVVTTHISVLDDDGTYTNETRVNKEERNVDYVTQTDSSAFIVANTKAVKGKNIIPSAPGIGSTKATKSDGGLYTTEVTEYIIKGGEESTEKVETSTESRFTRSSVSSAKDTSGASAKDGKIVAVTTRQDNQGAWHNQVSLIVEKTAVVSESMTKSPFIDTNTVVTKNASAKETIGDSAVGRVTNSLTDGGLHNTEVTTYEIKGGLKSESKQDTVFSSINQTTNISSGKENTGASSGGGRAISSSAVVDEATGAWTNTVTTTTEKQGNRGKGSAEDAYQETTTDIKVSNAFDTASYSVGKIETVEASLTETGLYKQTKNTSTAKELNWTTTSQRPLGVQVKVEEFRNKRTRIEAPSASVYKIEESKNKYGVFDGSRTTYSKKNGKCYARSMTTGDVDSTTREYTEQQGETTLQEPVFKEYSKGSNIITEVKSVDETTGLGVLTKREERPKGEESQEFTYNAGSFKENTDKFIWNATDINSFKPKTDVNTVSASVSVSRDKFGNYNGLVRVVKDTGKDDGKGGMWQSTFDERDIVKVIQEPHLDTWQPYIRTITITYNYGIKEYEQQALNEYKQSIHLPQYGIIGKFEPIRLNGRDTHFGGRYTRITKVVIRDKDYGKNVTSKLTSGDGKLPNGGSITFHENGIPTYSF